MKFRDTKISGNRCPTCNKLTDGAASFIDATPKENDISICIFCYSVAIFDKKLKLRKLEKEELTSKDWRKISAMVQQLRDVKDERRN